MACSIPELKEKIIWSPITTGLATAVDAEQSQVKAILECMERDALITHYYNTLTPKRLDTAYLCEQDPEIKAIMDQLHRYQLKVHLLDLSADFPVEALCAVVVDTTDNEPIYSFGMRTSFSLKTAVLDSIKEALTMRPYQRFTEKTSYPTNFADFKMLDRGNYWAKKEHASQLDFFISGDLIQKKLARSDVPWGDQLRQLVSWFKEKKYEVTVANLSNSKYNAPKWHIYMAVCPQLQPMHLYEALACVEGIRMREVPAYLGISNPKLNTVPHPFM